MPSRWHWNVAPLSGESNENDALVTWTNPLGPELMWTTGGVVSTVHEKVAGAVLWFPAGSVAHTEKVWSPFVTVCE